MDPALTYALIGAAAIVAAALITAFGPGLVQWFRDWRKSRPLAASIDQPKPGSVVESSFRCSGRVRRYRRGTNLWLVVERGDQCWPKEGHILPDAKTGKWDAAVFEDGEAGRFDLTLYAVSQSADERIQRWLEAGRATGRYPGLASREEMRKVAGVAGLALAKK